MGASEELVTIAFFAVMAIATILGALTGGFIGDGVGGYKDRRALGIVLGVYMIMVVATLIAGFAAKYFESPYIFVAAFFVMVFTENFVEPIFLGIMLTLVKPHEREMANSISLFVQMGLGYIPVPYIYGAIEKSDPGGETAMRVLCLSSLVGVVALIISIIARRQ